MDKKPKKELIDGIRDFLGDFEEPYDHREWKNFQRRRKIKKRKSIPLFVKLTGVAACISFMVYAAVKILPVFKGTDKADNRITNQAPEPSVTKEKKATDTLTLDSISSVPTPANSLYKGKELKPTGQPQKLTRKKRLREQIATAPVRDTISTADPEQIKQPVLKDTFRAIPFLKDFYENKMSLHEKLAKPINPQLPKPNTLSRSQTDRRHIHAGFNIDLGLSGKGILYGGGGSVQIPLSGRLRAEIGVNYSRMTVGTDMKVEKPDTISWHKTGIRHTVGMASLPISLNYMISDGFSLAFGIKPFMAITDQRTDIYQSYKWVLPDISSNNSIGYLVSERHELRRSDSLYKNKAYLGFIQLSGYISPPFLRKYNAVIAPYVAIPVSGLQKDPYRWVHGGVSFRIYLSGY